MVLTKKSDEGRSVTPSTDKKRRRLSAERTVEPPSESEQRQRAREWAERQGAQSSSSHNAPTASSSSLAANAPTSRSEPSTAEKPKRGRPVKSSFLEGASPIPVFSEPEEKETRPVRKIKKPVLSDSEDGPAVVSVVAKRKTTKKSEAAVSSTESPVTPKKESTASPRGRKAATPILPSPAASFLPSSPAPETNNVSTSNDSSSDVVNSQSCDNGFCGECCNNFHVVVGIVLLSWFIALFVDGTVGASCLVVAVIISSLRRFVDFLCDSCASKTEKCYYNSSAST